MKSASKKFLIFPTYEKLPFEYTDKTHCLSVAVFGKTTNFFHFFVIIGITGCKVLFIRRLCG